jgi:anti-sigma factor RsiW
LKEEIDAMTCDSELIVSYLYDELTGTERQQLERHLADCETCRAEVAGLRGTRTLLSGWAPPEPDLGFEVVRRPTVVGSPRRLRVSPAWGLAAAAVLVLAVASALANVEVQMGDGGFVVRTGWNRPAAAPAAAVPDPAPVSVAAAPADAQEIADLRARLVQLESALAARTPAASASTGGTQVALSPEVQRLVRQLIADSEKRQLGEIAVRMTQLHRDVDVARRADFARLQQAVAQVQDLNDTQVLRWQAVEDRLLRVVQQQR